MSHPERWKGFAPLPDDIEARVAALQPWFVARCIDLAYLFGSLARGLPAHDVDLALRSGCVRVSRLRDEIAEMLGTQRLDLVDLDTATPVLRFEILTTGRLLYAATDEVEEDFVMKTLWLYRDTRPLRERHHAYLRERLGVSK